MIQYIQTINGWTKASMIQAIKDRFTEQSVDHRTGRCLYRGPEGTMCAVGIFIPDDMYSPRMEQSGYLENLLKRNPALMSKMPLGQYAMRKLQKFHDSNGTIGGEMVAQDQSLKDKLIGWVEVNVVDDVE